MSSASKKKISQYSEEYLKFVFIPAVHDARLLFCLLCQQCLSNESMKPGRLKAHLKAKHEEQITSYQISLLIAKFGKNHTIGEQLIKPSISTFFKTVFGKDDQDVKSMPLSNNTDSRRIDEMSKDVEIQLIEKLKIRLFSVQMDESTLRDSEVVLLTYVSNTAPNMMGKKNGCLKLMKDENPDMLLVHCVIHRQNLVAKNLSPVLNKIMDLVVKCINSIKASAKQEHILKLFCEENNEAHVRLLLHTEVRWLSKGNCLKRFMEMFDTLSDFLSDKTEMQYLLTIDSKAYFSYLTDIFEKLNIFNKELQETNKTLVDAKAKIFGFITSIELYEKDVYQKQFEKFHWLQKCEVTDTAILNIVEHLKNL